MKLSCALQIPDLCFKDAAWGVVFPQPGDSLGGIAMHRVQDMGASHKGGCQGVCTGLSP